MLTALNTRTGQYVYAPDIPNLKDWYHENQLKGKIISTLTDAPVLPRSSFVRKNGASVRSHFYHPAESKVLDSIEFDPDFMRESPSGYTVKESREHIEVKRYVVEQLRERYTGKNDVRIVCEHRLPITRTGRYRIIDVAVLWPYGAIDAYEVQRSPLSVETLTERIADYESEGIISQWIFSDRAYSEDIKEWFGNHMGELPGRYTCYEEPSF